MSSIRYANSEDADKILEIYGPLVLNSEVTFEYVVPTLEKMKERITNTVKILPWLVCVDTENNLLGYAYACPWGDREGYRFSVEIAVYVAENCRGQQIGYTLGEKLLEILTKLGYYKVISRMTDKNVASQKLHEKLGFVRNSILRNLGHKFGQWIDVQVYEKDLQPCFADKPEAPISFEEWKNSVDLN